MDYILTKPRHFARLHAIYPAAGLVTRLPLAGGHLVCFGAGMIVPPSVLSRFIRAYNFHAASAEYPGRDPHHWAAYDGAGVYGAVAHVMTSRVDEGAIVGSLMMGMPKASPQTYRDVGERAAYTLFEALALPMFSEGVPPNGENWGVKHSRKHLIEMCDMRSCDEQEVIRRKAAFHGFEEMFK